MEEIIKKILPTPGEYNFNFRSRKMWIAIILFVFSIVLFVSPLVAVTFAEWFSFAKWVFGIYLISNAVSKATVEKNSNWKSRKLGGLLMILITTTIFLFTGSVVFAEWSNMTQWCFGVYSSSNVLSKYMNKMKE